MICDIDAGKMKTPKVFVSYSHEEPEHDSWVLDLASSLNITESAEGVEFICKHPEMFCSTNGPMSGEVTSRVAQSALVLGVKKVLVEKKPKSPSSDYHQLRKISKKLRYLMECFQSLYPKADVRPLIKEVNKPQDNLGEHHDLEVHIASLTSYGKELQTLSDADFGPLTAIEQFCCKFEKRKLQLRKEFRARFDEFSAKAHKKNFELLFHRRV